MAWWIWAFLGLILLGVEITTPGGFYILFFGLSALVVAALAGFGIAAVEWVQWLLFSVMSVASLLIFRSPLLRMIKSQDVTGPEVDTMIGEIAIPLEPLAPGGTGKAECRGTAWTAHNAGPVDLAKGQRSLVERVEGLALWLKPE
ncbi:MAG: NfeD family protein [Nitrospirota bacterium]|nr:NfeD family protein [Nitrospirota bacterium]